MMASSLVQEYDPVWVEWFVTLQKMLAGALGDACLSIEHVGSTSVPGLAAKGIIDIDIVFPSGGLARVVERLATLGYLHNGDQGVPGREAFKLADEEKKISLPTHHLYACQEGSGELGQSRVEVDKNGQRV